MATSSSVQAIFDPFRYLPTELILKILKYFYLRELAPCMLVSKTWNEMASDPNRFRRLRVGCWKDHGGKRYYQNWGYEWDDDLEPSECRQIFFDSQLIAKAQGRLVSVTIEAHPEQVLSYLKLVGGSQHGSCLTTLNLSNGAYRYSLDRKEILLDVCGASACSKTLQRLHLRGWTARFPRKSQGFSRFIQLSHLSLDNCDVWDRAVLPSTLESLSMRFSPISSKTAASWAAFSLPDLETVRWETDDTDWEPIPIPRLGFTTIDRVLDNGTGPRTRAFRVRDLQLLISGRGSRRKAEECINKSIVDLVSAYAETLESCTIKYRTIPPDALDIIATRMPNITDVDLSCEGGLASPILRVFADNYSRMHNATSKQLKVKANVFLTGPDAADGLREGFKKLVHIESRNRVWGHLRSGLIEYCAARGLQVDGFFELEIYRPYMRTPDSSDEYLASRCGRVHV